MTGVQTCALPICAASGKGAILTDHEIIPVVRLQHELEFHPGDRRLKSGTFSLTDIDGQQRDYRIRDLGWVYCQGGGYFGGFNDKLGQGVYRGEYHQEGEVWDVSHPTTITDSEGRSFEFDHDWAECFTLVESAAGNGMAHYECVRIRSKEA